jgi:hypothetical protein
VKAGDYTCDDWSGVSTPGRAINDQVVRPDKMRAFRLEPRMYRTRNWTMEFGSEAGGTYGRADIALPQSPNPDFTPVRLRRPNVSDRTRLYGGPSCYFAYLNTINTKAAPETPVSDYQVPDSNLLLNEQMIVLVSRKGQFALAICDSAPKPNIR